MEFPVLFLQWVAGRLQVNWWMVRRNSWLGRDLQLGVGLRLASIMFSHLRPLARPLLHKSTQRTFHTVPALRSSTFTNILASDNPPAVQVGSITPSGILLADGIILPSACIFLDGQVFLWDVPQTLWEGWTKDHFEIFEVVVPKPGWYTDSDLFSVVWFYIFLCPRDNAVWNWTENDITTSFFAFIYKRHWNSDGFHGHGASRVEDI